MPDQVMRGVVRDLETRLRYIAAAVSVALAWGLYVLKATLNIDLVAMTHPDRGPQSEKDTANATTVYLVIAIAATVIAPAWAMIKARKSHDLASRGKRTQGTVISLGLLSRHGMAPATIEFTVNGKLFRVKQDILKKDLAVGDTADILYDPQNPRRCTITFGMTKLIRSPQPDTVE